MWSAISAFLRSYGILLGIVIVGLVVAWRFVAPPPPDTIRIATGPDGGAYARTAETYARALEREGFRVERIRTEGSLDNLQQLRRGLVDIGFIQGGVVGADQARASASTGTRTPAEAGAAGDTRDLVSLGAIFPEPAWIFARRREDNANPLNRPDQRVAIGPPGSGTRALAIALLEANGATPDRYTAVPLAGTAAAEALLAGEVDVAVLVAAEPGEAISRLMRATGDGPIQLLNFTARARAYAILLPYLSPVTYPRSAFSLAEDLPREDVTLMAPAAYVAARADLNPQVAALLVGIMKEAHKGRQLFAAEGQFPNGLNHDVPLQKNAQRYYEQGPPFLQTYLPFRWAVAIDQFWVLLVPLVPLVLLLIRFAPPLYTWQMESKIYRLYEDLRRIEAGLPEKQDRATRRSATERLDALEAQVAGIKVPTSYGQKLFALRRDIGYVRETMGRPGVAAAAAQAMAKG